MPLIRGRHAFDDHFTQIPNAWLRDKRLSLAAIGLLAQLMSHKPGWQISQDSLGKANGLGRDAVRTILNELMEAGYLKRSEKRTRNSTGQLAGYVYTTTDPMSGEPTLGEPTQVAPTLAEPLHKNTISKEEQVIENNSKETASAQFNEFWNLYPRKLDKGRARKAFDSAIKRAKLEDILAGVIMYSNDPNRLEEFTKFPATWLNADAWENGPLPYDPRAQKLKEEEENKRKLDEWLNEQERLGR